MDLAKHSKDLHHAIREFAGRTVMLRDCCCRFIGDLLVALLTTTPTADVRSDPQGVPNGARDISSLTATDTAALGGMLLWSLSQGSPLHEAVDSQPVLSAMKSQYAWFLPMLEILSGQHLPDKKTMLLLRRPSLRKRASVMPDGSDATLDQVPAAQPTQPMPTSGSAALPRSDLSPSIKSEDVSAEREGTFDVIVPIPPDVESRAAVL